GDAADAHLRAGLSSTAEARPHHRRPRRDRHDWPIPRRRGNSISRPNPTLDTPDWTYKPPGLPGGILGSRSILETHRSMTVQTTAPARNGTAPPTAPGLWRSYVAIVVACFFWAA